MTEKELLDLLGDVRPDYIVQTEAFRRGGVRPRRKRHTGRRVLSLAAMLAAVLAAGALVRPGYSLEAGKSGDGCNDGSPEG